jgi:hypothetical protein
MVRSTLFAPYLFYTMYSSPLRDLKVLSGPSVDGSLSSAYLCFASLNVAVATVRFSGWIVSKNRKIWLLVLWLAFFAASCGLLVAVCLWKFHGTSDPLSTLFRLIN